MASFVSGVAQMLLDASNVSGVLCASTGRPMLVGGTLYLLFRDDAVADDYNAGESGSCSIDRIME